MVKLKILSMYGTPRLKHFKNLLQLCVPQPTKEHENISFLTEDHKQRVEDFACPLNHSTTISWGPDVLETFRENEKAIDSKENCLIYLLDKMNKSAEQLVGSSPSLDSLVITSMENRAVRKNIRAANSAKPLVVMHIGNNRAINVIPKKFSEDMKDVLNVTLGKFSVLMASRHIS